MFSNLNGTWLRAASDANAEIPYELRRYLQGPFAYIS